MGETPSMVEVALETVKVPIAGMTDQVTPSRFVPRTDASKFTD